MRGEARRCSAAICRDSHSRCGCRALGWPHSLQPSVQMLRTAHIALAFLPLLFTIGEALVSTASLAPSEAQPGPYLPPLARVSSPRPAGLICRRAARLLLGGSLRRRSGGSHHSAAPLRTKTPWPHACTCTRYTDIGRWPRPVRCRTRYPWPPTNAAVHAHVAFLSACMLYVASHVLGKGRPETAQYCWPE